MVPRIPRLGAGIGEANMEKRQTYTVDEASELLGIARNAAYAAVRSGQIPSIRIGKRIVVPKAALDRMLSGEAHSARTEREDT